MEISLAIEWLKGNKGSLLLFSVVLVSWIWLFYITWGIFPRLRCANYTQDQMDGLHEITSAPYLMFCAGIAMGCIVGMGYEREHTKRVKSPG